MLNRLLHKLPCPRSVNQLESCSLFHFLQKMLIEDYTHTNTSLSQQRSHSPKYWLLLWQQSALSYSLLANQPTCSHTVICCLAFISELCYTFLLFLTLYCFSILVPRFSFYFTVCLGLKLEKTFLTLHFSFCLRFCLPYLPFCLPCLMYLIKHIQMNGICRLQRKSDTLYNFYALLDDIEMVVAH